MTRAIDSDAPPGAASPPARRRSIGLRFGMRTLLIAGLIFCLLFGWFGRSLYRVRQEDAAIQDLLKAGGSVVLADAQREPVADPDKLPAAARLTDQLLRSIGWRRRPAVEAVVLEASDPDDPVAADALAAIGRLPEVDWVALNGQGFDDSSVDALGDIRRLKHLTLEGTTVTAAGLAKLRSPERVETLEVGCHLTQSGLLSGVVGMKGLRSIRAHDMHVTRADIEAVASLPNLQSLDLMSTLTDGESKFGSLAGDPSLAVLHLRAANFDSEEIDALASMPNLQTLWIEGATDDDLATLAKSRSLRTLGVAPPATRDAVQRLSAERPEWIVALGAETFHAGVSDAGSQGPSR